jgi:hypothetical protein
MALAAAIMAKKRTASTVEMRWNMAAEDERARERSDLKR